MASVSKRSRDSMTWRSLPIKAMSYLASSDARHGKYGRRPKVEIPENTESACKNHLSMERGALFNIVITWVPPSPGKVLYQSALWGPAIGNWFAWSPCASTLVVSTAAAKRCVNMFAKEQIKNQLNCNWGTEWKVSMQGGHTLWWACCASNASMHH